MFLDIPEELGVYWKSLRAELTPCLHSFWESCLREVNPSIIELQAKYTEVSTRLREKNTQRSLPPYLYHVDVEWLCRIYYGLARKVVTRNRAGFNSLIEVLKERVEELWYPVSWVPRVSDDRWPPEDQCSICYLSLLGTNQVRCNRCRNKLHQGCIQHWFEYNNNCPYWYVNYVNLR